MFPDPSHRAHLRCPVGLVGALLVVVIDLRHWLHLRPRPGACRHFNDLLRLSSNEGVQVLAPAPRELVRLVHDLNRSLLTTLGAIGNHGGHRVHPLFTLSSGFREDGGDNEVTWHRASPAAWAAFASLAVVLIVQEAARLATSAWKASWMR